MSSGKEVHAWAVEGDFDTSRIVSSIFTIEWPKGSGTLRDFPEVDRAAWFTHAEAQVKLLPAQRPFLDRLSLI